ncbi:unnamed protein product [Cyprideis torosa]|uniref:Histone deacetylase domain-containing protein n=1 Tax=Cyprideis torosa TaxID=163714 RepID=A0A7R8WA68_9CRUS|nr:unnamed protein product [Cyprideis torosa]CAG0890657.1 unnamed protein product [Cyprideis torosa]
MGIERLHPFDTKKWSRVFRFLVDAGMLKGAADIFEPDIVPEAILKEVHTEQYLNSLKSSAVIASIAELSELSAAPNCLIQKYLLIPMKYHVGGTILATEVALERGWAINIGGGFHHCSRSQGSGYCFYADITIAILEARKKRRGLKVLIVDLDAHQGNGHERDFIHDSEVKIMDVYNGDIYPLDEEAKRGITFDYPLRSGTSDKDYLKVVQSGLEQAFFNEYDLVFYNAGTDCMAGDLQGELEITPTGIVKRDELVFEAAVKRHTPIVLVTSGGYTSDSARVIADSILNLHKKRLITPNKRSSGTDRSAANMSVVKKQNEESDFSKRPSS